MKTTLSLAVLLAVTQMVYSNEEMKPTLELIAECKNETGFEEDPRTTMIDDTRKTAKCFSACFMQKEGLIKKDGSLDVEKAKEYVSKINPDLKEKISHIVEECDALMKTNKNDVCESAYIFLKCQGDKLITKS